jgi:cytochrome P450
MARLVNEDMEYLGCPMKEDDWILLGFPAANRDPVVFKDADKFIIDRAENRHVAFGLGIHRCIGSNLARLELRVAIEEFIRRYPKFELANKDDVTWAPGQIPWSKEPAVADLELVRVPRRAVKRPVEDFATDWDHTDPAVGERPLPDLGGPARALPGRPHRSLRGRLVPHDARDGVPGRQRHGALHESAWWSSPTTSTRRTPSRPIGTAPPITSDPPFHQFARRLILPAFAPGPVNALEASSARALHQAPRRAGGTRESSTRGASYAQFIPPGVISTMLGFPEEDEDRSFATSSTWSSTSSTCPSKSAAPLFVPMAEYFTEQIEDHVANPRDDLTSYLLNVEFNGEKLSIEHVRGTMVLILVAGIDTTWSAIGAAIWHLAQHPDDLARLVNEPELLPVAVEEFLRFYAPVTMARLVKEDIEFHGCPMKKDDWVLLGFPAANRDPEAFEDADTFIIDRAAQSPRRLRTWGIHRCVGSNLARMELRVAIEEFIARFPKFELSDPGAVTWAPGQVRGPRAIPVRILA